MLSWLCASSKSCIGLCADFRPMSSAVFISHIPSLCLIQIVHAWPRRKGLLTRNKARMAIPPLIVRASSQRWFLQNRYTCARYVTDPNLVFPRVQSRSSRIIDRPLHSDICFCANPSGRITSSSPWTWSRQRQKSSAVCSIWKPAVGRGININLSGREDVNVGEAPWRRELTQVIKAAWVMPAPVTGSEVLTP